ncbi:Cleavage stimulation factor subunit 2 [Erysiphe necator]|uniref:Putative rna recognition motif containing protein n=1 Tax=Uncinula necator TaxID=52586 RepID=A0A0B1NY52_UNCNE|nr:Cleavage stimulation factor subunit 2 [Erysiphe necator]KHJ30893.1 putative rna recognition motif containing protein [Erysiphe necator]
MSSKQPSKSVFVGNIPYGLTEEQIIRIFSSAGKVLNFRLVYDRETGRPKGFGFVEFPDSDSASSAVRNLNDYEIMNRKLRVDFSNDGNDEDNSNNNTTSTTTQLALPYQSFPPSNGLPQPPNSSHIMVPQTNPTNNSSAIPPLPLGVEVPPGLSCPDAISRTLNTLPPQQLLDVLSQMKTLATTDAAKATELLHQAPQLSYAIFQALLLMNLISTEALGSVVEQATTAAAAPINHQVAPQVAPQVVPPQQPIPPVYGALPPNAYPQTYTAPQPSYGVPPSRNQPVIAQATPQPVAGGLDTEQLMQQVLAMPQELIDTLPVAERNQLLALRASYGR